MKKIWYPSWIQDRYCISGGRQEHLPTMGQQCKLTFKFCISDRVSLLYCLPTKIHCSFAKVCSLIKDCAKWNSTNNTVKNLHIVSILVLSVKTYPALATLIDCCSIASWMLILSCSLMLLNSSMQHRPPSDSTRAPASRCQSTPSFTAVTVSPTGKKNIMSH